MDELIVSAPKKLSGEITVPGDKSISHRAVLLGSLAQGKTEIINFLHGEDCRSTIECMRNMGVSIEENGDNIIVHGQGIQLKPSGKTLDAGNSGTTVRLLMGILSGQHFDTDLTGDESLQKRPMLRVAEPLRLMGASVEGKDGGNNLPITIKGGKLKNIDYKMPVASAQVKSAILLAGLFADGITTVNEYRSTRDHTERMLKQFGVETAGNDLIKAVKGPAKLKGCRINVPGDISSAAFFMVAASIIPGSDIIIRDIGINPTRTGLLDILIKMGAEISVFNQRKYGNEPVADIRVRGVEKLKGQTIDGEIIPRLIDEIPVIAVAALKADGITIIKDAAELRVKESDRIKILTHELRRFGARVEERPDGLLIEGGYPLQGCKCASYGDHRMAMALAVAGLIASDETIVADSNCMKISYPTFNEDLKEITEGFGR